MKKDIKIKAAIFTAALIAFGIFFMLEFSKNSMANTPPAILQGEVNSPNKAPMHQKSAKVKIVAVGDMMIGNWGEDLLYKYGANYPFEKVAPYLKEADIATGNLEGPHCGVGKAMDKKYVFRISPKWLAGYKWAGFDVLNVANNHAMDYGGECFLQSNRNIRKLGMDLCGGGKNVYDGNRPAVIERNGTRIAFLGYSATYPKEAWAGAKTPGTIFPERSRVINAVKEASNKYDLLVVHFHWGGEGRTVPKDYQKDLAHLVIDNGADLVIGHHPHLLQGIELYKGRLIFYSLGNFIFASYSKRAKTSVMVAVELEKTGKIFKARVVPVNVYNYDVHLQTAPMPGDPNIIQELNEVSAAITWGKGVRIDSKGGIILISQ